MRNLSEIALATLSIQRLEKLRLDALKERKLRHLEKNGHDSTLWEMMWARDIVRLPKEERKIGRQELVNSIRSKLPWRKETIEKDGGHKGDGDEQNELRSASGGEDRHEAGYVYPDTGQRPSSSVQQRDSSADAVSHDFADTLAGATSHDNDGSGRRSSRRSPGTRAPSARSDRPHHSRHRSRTPNRSRSVRSLEPTHSRSLTSERRRSRSRHSTRSTRPKHEKKTRDEAPIPPPLPTIPEAGPEGEQSTTDQPPVRSERARELHGLLSSRIHDVDVAELPAPARSHSPAISENPSILVDLASTHDESRKHSHRNRTDSNTRSEQRPMPGQYHSRASSRASKERHGDSDPTHLIPDDARKADRSSRSRSRSTAAHGRDRLSSVSSRESWERWSPSQASSFSSERPASSVPRHSSRERTLPAQDAPKWGFGDVGQSETRDRSGSPKDRRKSRIAGMHVEQRSGRRKTFVSRQSSSSSGSGSDVSGLSTRASVNERMRKIGKEN